MPQIPAPTQDFSWFPNIHIEALQAYFADREQSACHEGLRAAHAPKARLRSTKGHQRDLRAFTFEDAAASHAASGDVVIHSPASRKTLFAYILQLTSLTAASLQRIRKVPPGLNLAQSVSAIALPTCRSCPANPRKLARAHPVWPMFCLQFASHYTLARSIRTCRLWKLSVTPFFV